MMLKNQCLNISIIMCELLKRFNFDTTVVKGCFKYNDHNYRHHFWTVCWIECSAFILDISHYVTVICNCSILSGVELEELYNSKFFDEKNDSNVLLSWGPEIMLLPENCKIFDEESTSAILLEKQYEIYHNNPQMFQNTIDSDDNILYKNFAAIQKCINTYQSIIEGYQ